MRFGSTCRCVPLMRVQGHEEPNGRAKVTRGHNLPAAHAIHTVGPIVRGIVPTARETCAFLDAGTTSVERVVFDVFTDEDLAIYRDLLG